MQAAGTQYTEDIQEKTAKIFTLFPEELLKETPSATILVPVKLPVTNTPQAGLRQRRRYDARYTRRSNGLYRLRCPGTAPAPRPSGHMD